MVIFSMKGAAVDLWLIMMKCDYKKPKKWLHVVSLAFSLFLSQSIVSSIYILSLSQKKKKKKKGFIIVGSTDRLGIVLEELQNPLGILILHGNIHTKFFFG